MEEVCEIDLSKEEDNVTSLAVGKTAGKKTLIYAGINSSPKDLDTGNNEHYKTFGLETTVKGKQKTTETKISEVSRSKLFQEKDKDAYQRVLRLSRPYPKSPQLGAISTGLARSPEIVVFDTSKASPNIRGRILPVNEAEDTDMIQTGEDEFKLAYCDKRNIYIKTISPKADASDPNLTYATPGQTTDGSPMPALPSFRSLRFLTPGFLLMLTNVHSNSGVVLQVLRLDPDHNIHARIPISKRLPDNIKKATGLAVVNLSPPLLPGDKQEPTQFVIAVAGHDCSITIFTLEYEVVGSVDQFSNLRSVKVLKDVHPNILTSITFSNFQPPQPSVTGSAKPQYLKLASGSMVNTVVVYTLPLLPLPISEEVKTPRYVLAISSKKRFLSLNVLIALFAIALSLMATQGMLEYQGIVKPYLGLTQPQISQNWAAIKRGYAPRGSYEDQFTKSPVSASPITDDSPAVVTDSVKLHQLLSRTGAEPGVLLIREEHDVSDAGTSPSVPGSIKASLHDESAHGPHGGRAWEMLSDEEKKIWKRKLIDAGHWTEGQGETVLKGIFFAQVGGIVRAAVQGAMGM